ncbi:OST3/OST6 family protein ASCRUDRAFT_30105 [Ascoidea rubescens DSM 1968]|uniref:Uncharacterized protein n=1 Tax=Ascoidea rubescens DSM 1968 TaxID=1344418 RepID=A0A1D2VRR7_9ASCO|nr:hypothetical protein ASCRUDRAFT_30105 [Ascoidea rubescens DSM 1968]ODV64301.1 hypothetical protein ASCRUDRAFT_30105 [Ascoidea rubescens DSM 1968]
MKFISNKLVFFFVFVLITFLIQDANCFKSEQISKILKKNGNPSILKLSSRNYKNIICEDRDYHLFVYLTATNPQINCVTCFQFQPIYEILASSYSKENNINSIKDSQNGDETPIFFAIADFGVSQNQREIFQSYKITSVPKLYYYSPTNVTKNDLIADVHDEYVFSFSSSTIDKDEVLGDFRNWIYETTNQRIKIYKPINYSNIFLTSVISIIIVFIFKTFYSTILNKVLLNKNVWSSFSILLIILFISGYMFNTIRNVPYLKIDPNGGSAVEYFVSGQQQQLGIETQIVSMLYAVLSVSVVVLIKSVPQIYNAKVNYVTTLFFVSLILLLASSLVCIFHKKSPGYPYYLLHIFDL